MVPVAWGWLVREGECNRVTEGMEVSLCCCCCRWYSEWAWQGHLGCNKNHSMTLFRWEAIAMQRPVWSLGMQND